MEGMAASHQCEVVLVRLAEADARVETDPLGGDACIEQRNGKWFGVWKGKPDEDI